MSHETNDAASDTDTEKNKAADYRNPDDKDNPNSLLCVWRQHTFAIFAVVSDAVAVYEALASIVNAGV